MARGIHVISNLPCFHRAAVGQGDREEWLCHGPERASPLGVDFLSLGPDGTLPRGSATVCKVATRWQASFS